jgi:predicted Kef-type K+ transport protein
MVIAGTLGVKMGMINETTRDSLVLAGIFSSILFPSLFRPLARKILDNKVLQQKNILKSQG